jgi:sugar phosphate isomerase/epimerase
MGNRQLALWLGATMKSKLACADFTFPLLGHDNALDLIAMLGFDGVDIGLFEDRSHLQPSSEFRQVARSASRLKKSLSQRGLQAADVFLQTAADFKAFAINHPLAARRRKARDWFLKTLEYASGIGASHVTTLPGVYHPDESRARSWGRMAEELAWRVEQATAHGITFSVEAHLGSIAPTPQAAQKLVESTPGLTLTLDYTHFTRQGLPDRAVEPLLKSASHFHVRGACKGRLQTSLERNTIDYRRIVKVMHETGYQGYIGIEYVWTEWERCNEVDNLSETIRWRDFFHSLAK